MPRTDPERWHNNFGALFGKLADPISRWNEGEAFGSAVTITYRFADVYPAYSRQLSDPATQFRALPTEHRSIVLEVLREIERFTKIVFVEAKDLPDEKVDIMISGTIFAGGAANFPSLNWPYAGDIFIGIGSATGHNDSESGVDVVGDGSFAGFREVFIHELGHALGLSHPRNYVNSDGSFNGTSEGYRVAIDPTLENHLHTVMSYFAAEGATASQWVRTFMPLDILALQYLYGVNADGSSGNDIYQFSARNPGIRTLWDSGGFDTLDLSNMTVGANVDLRPGGVSSIGMVATDSEYAGRFTSIAVNNLVTGPNTLIEAVIGTSFADILRGNEADNVITGGFGADVLTGDLGADIYCDTAAGLNGDTIVGFATNDKISILDADIGSFGFALKGDTLTYSGGSIKFDTRPDFQLVARLGASGGIELSLSDKPLLPEMLSDFDGDGRSDVLLQNVTTGAITVWRAQANGSLSDAGNLAPNALDASWKVAGYGDFNGDGRDDVLWRHSSGVIGQWSGQTGVFTNNSGVAANPVDNSWSVAGVADYNGDGRDDILWRHSSGEIGQWLAQPNGSFANNGGAAANLVDPSWTVKASGDFNGDGRADILWQHSSGVYAEWLGSATGKLNNAGGVMTGATGSVVGSGDFNGDGRDDILMRNPTTGSLTVWQAQASGQFTATTPTAQLTDLNWKVAAIGDFNGDGRDDLIWKHRSGATGEWLGTSAGDFNNNGAALSVPNGWAVISPEIWVV